MYERSSSPLEFHKKLNTDRSQHIPLSYRNSESHIFDYSLVKNVSQVLNKNEKKKTFLNQDKRKKSLSSYYFKNCKKNGKNVDTQSFSKYLKSKNENDQTRKRCITTANQTTNKISFQTQLSQSKQKRTDLSFQLDLSNKIETFCKNHPSKIAYFQDEASEDCYCHQCSIEGVKGNKRLIQLTNQTLQIKRTIKGKIEETLKNGAQICDSIKLKINLSVKSLKEQYNKLKMQIVSQNYNLIKNSQTDFGFSLTQIDWSFIEKIHLSSDKHKIPELSFLNSINRNYRVNKSERVEQEDQNFTIHEFSSEMQLSPVPLITSAERQRMDKALNLQPKPKKNLMKEIQKALNYQSRKTQLKVKTISLKHDKSSSCYGESSCKVNKENIEPNLINQNHNLTHDGQKQMKRLTFGSFL